MGSPFLTFAKSCCSCGGGGKSSSSALSITSEMLRTGNGLSGLCGVACEVTSGGGGGSGEASSVRMLFCLLNSLLEWISSSQTGELNLGFWASTSPPSSSTSFSSSSSLPSNGVNNDFLSSQSEQDSAVLFPESVSWAVVSTSFSSFTFSLSFSFLLRQQIRRRVRSRRSRTPPTPATIPITSSRLTRLLLLSGTGGVGEVGDREG